MNERTRRPRQKRPITKYDQLKDRLKIDKFDLDTEVAEQSALHEEVGREFAAAKARRDTVKTKLKEIEAKLDAQFRKAPSAGRVTEAEIKHRMQLSPKHKVAVDDYIKACQAADELETLLGSFDQRNYMLSRMVDLYIASYFSREKISTDHKLKDVKYEKGRELKRQRLGK